MGSMQQVGDAAMQQAAERARQIFRAAGRPLSFRRRERLMAEGDPADRVLLIESGLVKVVLSAPNGENMIAGWWGSGYLIGERGVLECRPRTSTVDGHWPGTATQISAALFRELIRNDPDMRALRDVTRIQQLSNADRRHIQASMGVEQRVISQLLEWVGRFGTSGPAGPVLQGFSHGDLAGSVLASRQHVDAVLQRLRAEGLLHTRHLRYVLPDPEGLRRRLNGSD